MTNKYDRGYDLLILVLTIFVLAGAAVIYSIIEWN